MVLEEPCNFSEGARFTFGINLCVLALIQVVRATFARAC